MKQNVIEFFQNLPNEKHEQFNEAFKLYRESPTKSEAVERMLNAGGYSERVLENLLYDLQKMHGITDVEKVPVQVADSSLQGADERIFVGVKPIFEMADEELFLWANKRQEELGDVNELLELAIAQNADKATEVLTKAWGFVIDSLKDLNDKKDINDIDVVTTNDSDIDTVKILTEEKQNLISENEDLLDEKENLEFEKEELEAENEALKEENQTLKLSPKIDNQSIRVEFPFLNNADCPDEFKILIADKITAWNRYLELQEQIADAGLGKTALTEKELASLGGEAVKCFDDNQKIYDELNAYQTTGKVLGIHPIFRRLQLTREVEIMTPDELHNFKGSSAKYFSDNRKQLAKATKEKNEERILEINTRVADRVVKLALVNKTLGISPK